MNIFNIKNIKPLEIVLFIFILLIVYVLFINYDNKEGFEEKTKIIKKQGNEIFDELYCNIYDDLVLCKEKNIFEINTLFQKLDCNSKSQVLDIGSGTGHHVNLISKKCNNVIGIDKSTQMIKKAKYRRNLYFYMYGYISINIYISMFIYIYIDVYIYIYMCVCV